MSVGWSQGRFHERTVGLDLDLKAQISSGEMLGKQQGMGKSCSKDSDPRTGTEDFVGQMATSLEKCENKPQQGISDPVGYGRRERIPGLSIKVL